MELTERRRRILQAVVESYIETAEPIGSKAVAARAGLTCSSATIRSEMAELEKLGLLEQPHTSAGRIPSAQGYRLYVNQLMEQQRLSVQETERINESLQVKMTELDRVLDQAGKMVSQMTHYPAFSMTASAVRPTITRYDLLLVDKGSFIVVVMTNASTVKNKLIKLATEVTQAQLEMLGALLNATFTGRTMEELSQELNRVTKQTTARSYGLISLVVSFGIEVLEEAEKTSIHVSGVNRLLEHSEYQDLDKANKLMNYLAENPDLGQQLHGALEEDSARVIIGPENVAEELRDSSVVLASYDIGEGMRGIIGVVGPTRMDYNKITARLSYFAESLGRMFGKGDPKLESGNASPPAQLPQPEQPKKLQSPATPPDEAEKGGS